MKVGDLVTLRWGEHPRSVGTIIKALRGRMTVQAGRSCGLGQDELIGFQRQIWRR